MPDIGTRNASATNVCEFFNHARNRVRVCHLFLASSLTMVYVQYVQQREELTDGIMTRQSYTFTIPSLPRGQER